MLKTEVNRDRFRQVAEHMQAIDGNNAINRLVDAYFKAHKLTPRDASLPPTQRKRTTGGKDRPVPGITKDEHMA